MILQSLQTSAIVFELQPSQEYCTLCKENVDTNTTTITECKWACQSSCILSLRRKKLACLPCSFSSRPVLFCPALVPPRAERPALWSRSRRRRIQRASQSLNGALVSECLNGYNISVHQHRIQRVVHQFAVDVFHIQTCDISQYFVDASCSLSHRSCYHILLPHRSTRCREIIDLRSWGKLVSFPLQYLKYVLRAIEHDVS